MLDSLFNELIAGGTLPIVSFLLTYLSHSTIMLGTVWLLARSPFLRSYSLKDLLLKTALIGSLLTTVVHISINPSSLFGRWELAASGHASAQIDSPRITGEELDWLAYVEDESHLQPLQGQGEIAKAKDRSGMSVNATLPDSRPWWPFWLVGFWVIGIAGTSLRFIRAKAALRMSLRARRDLITGAMAERLHTIETRNRLARPIRLTESGEIASPMVVGTREICLPKKAVSDLSPEQQESLLAHEVAHIVRQDQLWLWTCQFLEILFFFQPLVRTARRELQETAEFLCDDWAVRNTGRPLSLAKCLAEVAAWMQHQPQAIPVVGMAEIRSPLIRRVQRLLNPQRCDTKDLPRPARFALGLLFLAAALTVAPNFATSERETGASANAEQRTRRSTSAEILTTDKPNVFAVRVKWHETYDGRVFKAKARGKFSFSDDDTQITYLSQGGYLELQEELDGLKRKFEVRGKTESDLSLAYWENGNRLEWTASSQAWFKEMLVEFVREVNIYDANRAWRILEKEGIEALREEIDKIRNDSVRRTYERVLRQTGEAHKENRRP